MPSKRATITPVSKVENTFIPITFGAKICIYSEKPRLCVFYDVASDSPGSIFLVLFWGDCQKRTPKPKSRADGISPVHLTYFAIFPRPHSYNSSITWSTKRMSNVSAAFLTASVKRSSALLGLRAPDGWLCTMIKDTAL